MWHSLCAGWCLRSLHLTVRATVSCLVSAPALPSLLPWFSSAFHLTTFPGHSDRSRALPVQDCRSAIRSVRLPPALAAPWDSVHEGGSPSARPSFLAAWLTGLISLLSGGLPAAALLERSAGPGLCFLLHPQLFGSSAFLKGIFAGCGTLV